MLRDLLAGNELAGYALFDLAEERNRRFADDTLDYAFIDWLEAGDIWVRFIEPRTGWESEPKLRPRIDRTEDGFFLYLTYNYFADTSIRLRVKEGNVQGATNVRTRESADEAQITSDIFVRFEE
jgi:hypothetical protein